MFLRICSYNPAHSRALLEASGGGAGCGACAFVPCKHGARAARGSALGQNDPTRFSSLPMPATTSANAGNAPSKGEPPAGRPTPCGAPKGAAFPSPRGRARPPRRAHFTGGATRRSAPRSSRANTRRATAGNTRRPPAGPTDTAADFAWLFDKVSRTFRSGARVSRVSLAHRERVAIVADKFTQSVQA